MITASPPKLPEQEQTKRELEAMSRYSPHQRAEALSLFIGENMEPAAIALQLGLPAAVIAWFAEQDKWVDKRKAIEAALIEETASVERRLVLEQRPQIRRRHIENAEKLEEAALDMAQTANLSAHQLKSAIDAYAAAAGIAARAVGLDDGTGRPAAAGANVNVAVSPVIMVGAVPRAPVADMRRTQGAVIDVDTEGPRPPTSIPAEEPCAAAGAPSRVAEEPVLPVAPGDREGPGAPGVQAVRVDGQV